MNLMQHQSSLSELPHLPSKLLVYASAVATFYTLSDLSGINGMCYECIHAVNTWHHRNDHFDCMFLNTDPLQLGMHGLDVAQARLFFSFTFELTPVLIFIGFQRLGMMQMSVLGCGL